MRVGFIGWRGMVGSVLMDRMRAEGDFAGLEPHFFSTSAAGQPGPIEGGEAPLLDARGVAALSACEVVITCQGGDYTQAVHPSLRASGWQGIWIDAASALRMEPTSCLVLDPVNRDAVREALAGGVGDYVGANCTVSLLLMALVGLLRTGGVRFVTTMSYQAASGAGAQAMLELLAQMRHIGDVAGPHLDAGAQALAVEKAVRQGLAGAPADVLGAPLAGSALPWIDRGLENGQTREEWKAQAEASKLLGTPTPIDGMCVRIGALRSHAQGLAIHLRRPMPLDEVTAHLAEAHEWVTVVPNNMDATLRELTPAATSGSLSVRIGRLRPSAVGPDVIHAFTVGDQLLWGAAEPLRRMLHLVREHREA